MGATPSPTVTQKSKARVKVSEAEAKSLPEDFFDDEVKPLGYSQSILNQKETAILDEFEAEIEVAHNLAKAVINEKEYRKREADFEDQVDDQLNAIKGFEEFKKKIMIRRQTAKVAEVQDKKTSIIEETKPEGKSDSDEELDLDAISDMSAINWREK